MQPCPHCGSRKPRSGPKCVSCGATVEEATQLGNPGYKPSWLVDEELQKPLRGVLRKREKRPETSAEPTPPVEVPVIRLHDETYVNGQYIETAPLGQEIRNAGQSISPVRGSEQSLPPVNIANITPTYPSKLAASSPVDTPSAVSPPVVSTPDLEEETHFAAEFWVKSEEDTPSKQSPTSNQSSSSAASGMPPVAATPTGKPLTYNPQTTTQARTRSITAQAVKVEQAAAAFTPTDYLDKNLAGSVVYTSVKKSSSRRWLVALCAVVITAGTAVYMIGGGKTPELDLPAFGSGAKNSTSNEAVGSFGTPIQPLVVSAEGRSTAQLDAALSLLGVPANVAVSPGTRTLSPLQERRLTNR